MKRVIIDMDHVMAEISTQYLRWYKTHTGIDVDPANLVGKAETEAFPDGKLLRSFLDKPGFFRTAPVIAGSQEVIEKLNNVYEVFIVSAAMEFPRSLFEKYEWLQEHFPFITWRQIAFCGSKNLIKGDYMIDDYTKNLDYFEGEKLLYSAPHNHFVNRHRRVNNWKEVAAILLPAETVKESVSVEVDIVHA